MDILKGLDWMGSFFLQYWLDTVLHAMFIFCSKYLLNLAVLYNCLFISWPKSLHKIACTIC